MRLAYQSLLYMQMKTVSSVEIVQIYSGAVTPRSRLCFCEAVYIGQVNPLLTYSTQEAWFYLNGLVVTPIKSYCHYTVPD